MRNKAALMTFMAIFGLLIIVLIQFPEFREYLRDASTLAFRAG